MEIVLQLREDIQKNNINIYPILERHDLDEEEARTTSRIRVSGCSEITVKPVYNGHPWEMGR